ncbi:hypothetical protein LTS10_012865 [Elasticomyces elasticus]|nr:hypothetical protein LTS10_012865 [Elasticomyces elasticus]
MYRPTHPTPMDFQFDNRTGPIDAQSAFARVGQTPVSTKKRSYSTYDSPSPTKSSTTYTSPNKPLPPRPVFNALFSTPRKANDNWGDDSSAGETPRSPELPVADSPADTPDYAQRTEVRRLEFLGAGMGLLPHEREPEKSSGSGRRRESWFSTQLGRARGKWGGGFSPGRGQGAGEMVGMEKRGVEKRKKKAAVGVGRGKGGGTRAQQQRRRERRDEDSYEDSEAEGDEDHSEHTTANNTNERRVGSPRKSSRNTHQHPNTTTADHIQPTPTPPEVKQHWMKQLYTFLESHPTIPHILTFYAQLAFNTFLLCLLAYTIYTIYSTFAHDIALASAEATSNILAEMAGCARDYTANRCDPLTRVPAMEVVCEEWRRCMSRDARQVGRAGVGAKQFAGVVNSFVEAISWKTMAFTFLLVFGVFGGGNFAFGLFRRSDTVNAWGGHGGGNGLGGGHVGQHGGQGGGQGGGQAMGGWNGQPHPQQQGGWQGGYGAPPTPQRQFSGGQDGRGLEFYGGGTPWLRAMGGEGMEPQASQGAVIEGTGSGREVRRIGY